ncbi:MAG TPA: hypothetical protein VJ276_23510 [Thermoanaerobaculia bacterium]|nr:hypothetical protein [Thermoanaerobaculia bacterium]
MSRRLQAPAKWSAIVHAASGAMPRPSSIDRSTPYRSSARAAQAVRPNASTWRIVSLALLISGGVDLRASTVTVTLCDLYEHPEKYAGTTVIVRANATRSMAIEDFGTERRCSAYMRLKVELPRRAEVAAGVVLKRDEALAEFFEKLRKGMNVVATFEGRFDPVFVWRDRKRMKIKAESDVGATECQTDGRIILQRVSDVVGRPRPRR